MQISADFVHARMPFSDDELPPETFDSHLVVSITAPDDPSGPRPRLGIIPVLDKTGSMSHDNKLTTAKAAISHLCGFLTDGDTMGLVAFDQNAQVVVDPSDYSPSRIASALSPIRPGGSTNLAAGLEAGLELARHLAAEWQAEGVPFEIRVIVATDGLANVGLTHPDDIAELTEDLPKGVRVSTVGVGYDCDHGLLTRLAQPSGGSYGFAEGANAIPRLLGAEMGAALSVAASDIVVEVTPRKYIAELDPPLAATSTAAPDGGWRVHLPVLVAGETRSFVFPLRFNPPPKRHARPVTAADVAVTIPGSEPVELLPKVHFAGEVTTPAPSLVALVDRARAAAALAEAEKHASSGDFTLAAAVLSDFAATAADPAASGLVTSHIAYYSDARAYQSSLTTRSSAQTAMSPTSRLLGGDSNFDLTWSRTYGDSYQTKAMRQISLSLSQTLASPAPRTDSSAHTKQGADTSGDREGK